MKNGFSALTTAGALALAATLVACGGGGGGSSGGGSSTASATTEGVAAKGIISGAVVTAYRADGTEIGSTTTAEDGSYELGLKGYSGPVRLVLSAPAAPDVALVTCDAASCGPAGEGDLDVDTDGTIEFGERYALDYELSAIMNVDKTATTVSAHITPLTTLVEKRATAGGAILQPETVAVANSFLRQMLGLDTDPALIRPLDLTDPEADATDERALRYAVMNAAFEGLAQNSSRSVSDVLGDMAQDFGLNQVNEGELEGIWIAMEDVAITVTLGNEILGDEVASAADVARDDLYDAAMEICGGEGDCQVEVAVEGPVGTNLAAAKALVETARAVTIGAMESIDAKLEQYQYDAYGEVLLDGLGQPVTNEAYDPNNTFAQIERLTALNESTGTLTEAFGEVMGVVLSQAFGVISGEGTLEADLAVAAGLHFDDDRAEDCTWAVDPTACADWNASQRAAFVARFSNTAITHAGASWTVTGATYTPETEEGIEPQVVTVNVVLTLPEDLNLEATTHVIGVVGDASSAGGDLAIDQAQATVVLQEALDLASEEDVAPKFLSVSLDADAEISDGTDTFSGNFGVQFKRSANHAGLNPNSELNGLMPKLFTLNGSFTDGDDTANPLAIDLTLSVPNAEQFHFYEEGRQRNDLTTYTYDETSNTVTVTHGLPGNQIVVRFHAHETHPYGELYVSAEILSSVGEAWMDGMYPTMATGNGYWQSYPDMQPCYDNVENGMDWLLVGEHCYEWITGVDATGETLVYTAASGTADIRNAFRNSWIREILTRVHARVPGEGVYQAAPQWDEDYEEYGEDIIVFPAASGSLVATLDESEMDVNATNRYAKIDITASVVGRLSADLPEMNITLTGERTGYITAVSELTLQWGAEQLIVNYSGSNGGTITLTDGAGTVMELAPAATDLEVGRIVKDGTVYGVITRESDIYLVTWLDGSLSASGEIETLL